MPLNMRLGPRTAIVRLAACNKHRRVTMADSGVSAQLLEILAVDAISGSVGDHRFEPSCAISNEVCA